MKINHCPFVEQDLLPLPSRDECLALMAAHGMLPHIRDHSLLVTEVAIFLGQVLRDMGFDLHLPLIEAGALLHDLGKTPCLGTAENHAHWGSDVLYSLGYPHVAQIVKEHVHLDPAAADARPLREAEVVNYADKRVLHTRVVTLKERFADLEERYGRTAAALSRIAATQAKALALEQKIFAPLSLSPLDLININQLRR
jgi:putative nucleotidyltransferase with HDIG domain